MIMMNAELVSVETRRNLDAQGRTLEDLFFAVTEPADREGMADMSTAMAREDQSSNGEKGV